MVQIPQGEDEVIVDNGAMYIPLMTGLALPVTETSNTSATGLTIDGLNPNIQYYLRVAGVWGQVRSYRATGPATTQALPGVSKTWDAGGGDGLDVPKEMALPDFLDDLERQLILKAF